ncbi:MAG: bile acid:sodium symporter [Pseudomonadales bacterium]|nr:bile acid:sodium symporter [Pseudomonadales bacterium]
MFEFYVQQEYWFAAIQLILAMAGMGATLTGKDFKDVLVEPKAVSIGLGIQLLVVPITILILIKLFGLTGGVAVGFALIAAIPGGAVSNIFTHFANGNIALSISVTAITTLACLFTTPLILDFLIAPYMPNDFEMPAAKIATEIAFCLLIPLFLGMVFLKLFPDYAEKFSKFCIRGSLFVIVLIVIGSLGAGRLDFKAFGIVNIALVLLLTIVLALLARPFGKIFSLSQPDTTAVEMEVSVRSVNLGLLIKASLFPAVVGQADEFGDNVLFTLLLYGGLQLIAGAILIWWHRKASSK